MAWPAPPATPILRATCPGPDPVAGIAVVCLAAFGPVAAASLGTVCMMVVNAPPNAPGAGPTGPEGGSVGTGGGTSAGPGGDGATTDDGATEAVGSTGAASGSGDDPIFQGSEPVDRTTRRSALLFQFFLFPLLIVLASVGVFLFFGAIGGAEKSPKEFLVDIQTGGTNVQKQAAQQLAERLRRERADVEAGKVKTPFYADPGFRAELVRAFEGAFPDGTDDRKRFLALALGAVGDVAFVTPLVKHLRTAGGTDEHPDLRFAIAYALGDLRAPEAVPPLADLTKDTDTPIANIAVFGLGGTPGEASTKALLGAMSDARFEVRVNAAAFLARRGQDVGLGELEKTLDPAAHEGLGIPKSARQAALVSAIRGVSSLGIDRLKPRIEALAAGDSDAYVQRAAREALDAWGKPK